MKKIKKRIFDSNVGAVFFVGILLNLVRLSFHEINFLLYM